MKTKSESEINIKIGTTIRLERVACYAGAIFGAIGIPIFATGDSSFVLEQCAVIAGCLALNKFFFKVE